MRVSAAFFAVLEIISKCHYCTQKELRKGTKLSGSAVSKSLKNLVNKNFVVVLRGGVKTYKKNPLKVPEMKALLMGYETGKTKNIICVHAETWSGTLKNIPNNLNKKLTAKGEWTEFLPEHLIGLYRQLPEGNVKFLLSRNRGAREAKVFFYLRTYGPNLDVIDYVSQLKLQALIRWIEERYPKVKVDMLEGVKHDYNEIAMLKDEVAVRALQLGVKHKSIEKSFGYAEWEEKGLGAREDVERVIALREACKKEGVTYQEIEEALKLKKGWDDLISIAPTDKGSVTLSNGGSIRPRKEL